MYAVVRGILFSFTDTDELLMSFQLSQLFFPRLSMKMKTHRQSRDISVRFPQAASTSIGGSGGSNGPSGPGDGNGNGNGELKMLAADSPSYISSKSANSLISFSRPTRIQAVTLFYLNKILDEVLLQILASAKSLATDRIKSDGIVRVLGGASGSGSGAGALLAKNAVLEAEMELRSYTEGLRKEGGKVPLGLSATSRLDGTDNFPVKSAYDLVSFAPVTLLIIFSFSPLPSLFCTD